MRKWTLAALLVLTLPGLAVAQGKTTAPGGTPNQLSSEEFERLMTRAMGTWILNRQRSILMSGNTFGVPEGYLYVRTDDGKGVKFTNSGGPTTSIQYYDGKAYGGVTTSGGTTGSTIARMPIDEFTIDNITGSDGRRRGRNTQVYSPDGTKAAYIVRRVNEKGEETVISVVLYEKVPDGTPIPKPPADPAATTR